MRLLDGLAKRLGYSRTRPRTVCARGFAAGETDRLTWSFGGNHGSINSDLYTQLATMRARSRKLCADNEYAVRFLSVIQNALVGPTGVRLQSRARDNGGGLDRMANEMIEAEWKRWGRAGAFDVTGQLSRRDVERLCVETVARDGEFLLRIVDGFDNPDGIAVQLVDIDRLDINYNEEARPNGNRISMGVEIDAWMRPVAYHLLERHPGAVSSADALQPKNRTRVPAESIVHGFISTRPEQVRGIPWMHAAIIGLKDLGGFREAAIVAARVGAAKMGFWQSSDGASGPHDDAQGGQLITEAEAGTFDQIPANVNLVEWDPNYPNGEFGVFNKAVLRGIAGSLGVSYHTLASDLEGVNFSSARTGTIEDRDGFMCLQNWLTDTLHARLFPVWLRRQLATGRLAPLPAEKFDKFNAPTWQPRRWQWVDPLKDEQAHALAFGMRTKSLRQIIIERGQDPDEVFDEIAEDFAKLRGLGIEPTLPGSLQFDTAEAES